MPARVSPEKVARLRELADGERSLKQLASLAGVSHPTAARYARLLNLPILPPGARQHNQGAHYCRICSTPLRLETDGNGRAVVRCTGCERRKARRCIDCNRPVATKRAWRCPEHQRAATVAAIRRSAERHRATRNRGQRDRYRKLRGKARQEHLDYKKQWRKKNPLKVMLQKRRARLAGRGGFATREGYLEYHRAYRERHREDRARKERERIAARRAALGPPRCVDCGAEVPWDGKHRPPKRCPQHHRGARRPAQFRGVAA